MSNSSSSRRFWLVACALAGLTVPALAQEAAAPAAAQEAEPVSIDLAMNGLEAIGLKPVTDNLNLKVYGWMEVGYTYNTDSAPGGVNALRVFDDKDVGRMNQFVVNIERPLSEGKEFDLGGKIELMYGSDARFTESLYLMKNNRSDTGSPNSTQTDIMQFDPVQFYALARLPIGEGLQVKLGKYATTLGAEVIDGPGNALYSRSFLFGYAIPFAHTGIQFDYPVSETFSVYYGLVTGWDTFGDINSTPSHMVGYTWKITDKMTQFFNVITGPEQFDNSTTYRTVFDTTVSYQWTDEFSTSINLDWGNETVPDTTTEAGSNWYGMAAYATYKFTPQVAATLRGEYFRDETGSRIVGDLGTAVDLVEITFGFDIHPLRDFMNLRVRPEVRWDHSGGDDKLFDGGAKNDQFTIGGDVIITF